MARKDDMGMTSPGAALDGGTIQFSRPLATVFPSSVHLSRSSCWEAAAVVPGSITDMPNDFIRSMRMGTPSPLHPYERRPLPPCPSGRASQLGQEWIHGPDDLLL